MFPRYVGDIDKMHAQIGDKFPALHRKKLEPIGIEMTLNLANCVPSTHLMVEHRGNRRALYKLCYLDINSIYGSEINIAPTICWLY